MKLCLLCREQILNHEFIAHFKECRQAHAQRQEELAQKQESILAENNSLTEKLGLTSSENESLKSAL